MNVFLKLLLF